MYLLYFPVRLPRTHWIESVRADAVSHSRRHGLSPPWAVASKPLAHAKAVIFRQERQEQDMRRHKQMKIKSLLRIQIKRREKRCKNECKEKKNISKKDRVERK